MCAEAPESKRKGILFTLARRTQAVWEGTGEVSAIVESIKCKDELQSTEALRGPDIAR